MWQQRTVPVPSASPHSYKRAPGTILNLTITQTLEEPASLRELWESSNIKYKVRNVCVQQIETRFSICAVSWNYQRKALLLVYFNIWLTTFKCPIWLTLVCSRRHVDPGKVTWMWWRDISSEIHPPAARLTNKLKTNIQQTWEIVLKTVPSETCVL